MAISCWQRSMVQGIEVAVFVHLYLFFSRYWFLFKKILRCNNLFLRNPKFVTHIDNYEMQLYYLNEVESSAMFVDKSL